MTSAMNIPIHSTGPLALGLRRLVSEHPLYAVLIDKWRLVEDSGIDTMSVGIDYDLRVRLKYNLEFATRITPDELVNVLLHEVLHVVFRHLEMSRAEYPDSMALTVAQEVTVNEFVPDPLPGNPVKLESYPQLPPGESTAERYRRLARNTAGTQRRIQTHTIDSHDEWESASEQGELLTAVIMNDMREALATLPEDLQRDEALRLKSLEKHLPGRNAGDELIAVAGGGAPKTNWRSILRSFLWSASRPAPSLRRPSRRLPHLVGIVPGYQRIPDRPKAMAVIDTSGSMKTPKTLSTIRAEIQLLSASADIWVVECDTKIHREYLFSGKLEQVRGGGGTSFAKPLDPVYLSKRRIDAVFYFTDGFGFAPAVGPRVPLFWCLVGLWSRKPAPYGRALHIAESDLSTEEF